jgi:hypothetical protein
MHSCGYSSRDPWGMQKKTTGFPKKTTKNQRFKNDLNQNSYPVVSEIENIYVQKQFYQMNFF